MKLRQLFLIGLLAALAGGGGFGWYRYIFSPAPTVCGFCARPLHRNLSVTAEIGGRRAEVCCARCAVSEANQQHKPLRLIRVHDYPTGRAIAPEGAWFVEGSRAMACSHDAAPVDEMSGAEALAYDRCSPGTFSFAKRSDAEVFAARNGGSILSFRQLMQEARYP